MKKTKEIYNSAFTLDDLIQESVEMNNFLKEKINHPFQDENYYEKITKFFFRSIKLRNASKNNCWEKSNLSNSVSDLFLIFNRLITLKFLILLKAFKYQISY